MQRRDNRWYVIDKEEYPADPAVVVGAIEKIQALRKINLASRKPERHALFEVNEGMGVEVVFFGPAEKEIARFFIGKTGPDFLSTYLRRSDADEVFLFGEYLRGDFDKPVTAWRDKTIVAFNPAEAITVTIIKKKEKETISLTKDTQGNWHLEEPISSLAENLPVEKLLALLGDLKADGFADEKKELRSSGIDAPAYQVSVTLKDNQKKVLFIGNQKETGSYYAKSDEKPYLFLLGSGSVGRLSPVVKDLEKAKTEEEPPTGGKEPLPAPPLRSRP